MAKLYRTDVASSTRYVLMHCPAVPFANGVGR